MNNINGINSYPKLGSINAPKPASSDAAPQASPASQPGEKADQVEISSIARYLSQIAQMPDIRFEKVEQIRQALADGNYDMDSALSQAIDNMLEEEL
ncbi:MAG: flagellar biosynthesis anti-sigma factor FlgM [Sedimentisphaerales bacterium]|nr:flagellar biosynthesis anti-sigma factor FlgM [Sedimentisphaerales bacterium]